MKINASFTKRLRTFGGGIITSAVVTFIALYPKAHGEIAVSDCSLRDVAAWQTALADTAVELTPAYIQETTEAFLAACPTRPEVPQAHQVAAMAAVDQGDVPAALDHFAKAGPLYEDQPKYYYAAALLAAGKDRQAWEIRDQLVGQWLSKISYDPEVDIEDISLPGGTLYAISFARPGYQSGIRTAWVGVPDGAGWPATLTLGTERQRAAFRRLIADEDSPAHHVDFYRCRGRTLLADTETDFATDDMAEAARLTLIAYFDKPDLGGMSDTDTRPQTCLWPSRLLPLPGR